jgi:hypothetical protein
MKTPRKPKASDTPETDAYVAKLAHDWVLDFGAFDLLLTHARELERNRNLIQKAAITWMRSWTEIHNRVTQAEVAAEQAQEERDEARKIAEFAMLEADHLRPRHSTH